MKNITLSRIRTASGRSDDKESNCANIFHLRVSIFALCLIFFTYTKSAGQIKYLKADSVIDKTEKLKENKAGWTLLQDREKIDGYTRIGGSIFGGEVDCNVSPIKDADVSTFKVYPGTKYAKDKKHVYYPIMIRCIDYDDCGVCYYEKVIVENANPSKFRYLGKDYSTDGKHAYFRGQLIKEADGRTFKAIEGPEYFYFAADKNGVYMHEKTFRDADPSTFHYKKNDSRNNVSDFNTRYIIGDKNHEWEFSPPDSLKKL